MQQWQASASAAAGDASQPSQQETLLAAAAAIMVRLWRQALAGLAAGMQRLRTAPDAEQAEVRTLTWCDARLPSNISHVTGRLQVQSALTETMAALS